MDLQENINGNFIKDDTTLASKVSSAINQIANTSFPGYYRKAFSVVIEILKEEIVMIKND